MGSVWVVLWTAAVSNVVEIRRSLPWRLASVKAQMGYRAASPFAAACACPPLVSSTRTPDQMILPPGGWRTRIHATAWLRPNLAVAMRGVPWLMAPVAAAIAGYNL